MTNEWLDCNALSTFELSRSGNKFNFSTHPVDTEMDLTHCFGIDHPALVLRWRFKDKNGIKYCKVLFLSGSATDEEIKDYAEKMADGAAKRIKNGLVRKFVNGKLS